MSKERAVPDQVGHPNEEKDTTHRHNRDQKHILEPVTPRDAGPGRPQRYELPDDPPPDDDAC